MKYVIDKYDNFVVIEPLSDYLDGIGAAKLKGEFLLRNTAGQRNIVLDMSHVVETDESGIRMGILANRLCRAVGGVFILVGMQEKVREFLRMCSIEKSFLILNNIKEAEAYIFKNDIKKTEIGGSQ